MQNEWWQKLDGKVLMKATNWFEGNGALKRFQFASLLFDATTKEVGIGIGVQHPNGSTETKTWSGRAVAEPTDKGVRFVVLITSLKFGKERFDGLIWKAVIDIQSKNGKPPNTIADLEIRISLNGKAIDDYLASEQLFQFWERSQFDRSKIETIRN